MSAKASVWNWDPLFWPLFVGGALTPLAGAVLERWLPRAPAGGLGMFAAWTLVGIVISFRPPIRNWNLLKWIAAAAIGAIVGGGVVFVLEN